MKKTFQKLPVLIALIFILASLAVLWFLYREIDRTHKQAEEVTLEWQKEAAEREAVEAINNSVTAILPEKKILETHFAKSSDAVPFLDSLEALAPKVGAKAEITSVEISKDGKSLGVNLKATGSFAAVYKFLTLLENSPYEMEFLYMDLRRSSIIPEDASKETTKTPEWEAVFRIKLLSFIP